MRNSRNEKLFSHVFREILCLNIRENLQPGDLLPSEAQLCQDLQVSRNVIREAIKSMELMGMVEACPGRGTQVRAFSLDFIFQNVLFFHAAGDAASVRQMVEIRKAMEMSYMRDVFQRISREEIVKMREIVTRLRASWEREGTFIEEDREFHMTLFAPLKNPVLNSLMEAIWAVDSGFQIEKKRPHLAQSVTKHEAIVTALEEYDYMAFARAMEAHFSSGKYLNRDSYEEY